MLNQQKTFNTKVSRIRYILISFIQSYWMELLVFGAIFAVLLIDTAPNMTWINTDSDGTHYTYSAKYLLPSHKSSAPLFLLLGHLFLYIPFGTEFWRMALINVISGLVGSIFIYLSIKHFTSNRYYSLIGAIIYGGGALAISQNTIVESYPLVVTLCLGGYYFALKKRWVVTSVLIGCAGAVHPISVMFILPMLIKYRELRTWRRLGIMSVFVLFYLYIPLTNRPPYMWHQPNSEGVLGFLRDTFQTAQMLSSGLSIWDLPKRILDTGLQLLLNLGIGIAVLVLLFRKTKWYKDLLFWLIVLPIGYYIVDLAPQTYVYMQPGIAFGAIGIGVGLSRLVKYKKQLVYAVAITSIGVMVFNANYFDIGRTLDPNLSATEFWEKELPKVPDGNILMAQQGWEWAMVYKYNQDNNRNIIPVVVGNLPSLVYQGQLRDIGINVIDLPKVDLGNRPNAVAKYILDNNEKTWITKPTDAQNYGAEILPVNINGKFYTDNYKLLDDSYSAMSVTDGSRDLQWQFKPSNPYDITTGSIEVKEWRWIVFSNYNCLMFGMLGVIGFIPGWIMWQMFVKKKHFKTSNFKELRKGI